MATGHELYRLDDDVEVPDGLVLAHHLGGFVDAGKAASGAVAELLGSFEHTVVARFDADSLVDHRGRRPTMRFDTDHWADYDAPHITLSLLRGPGAPLDERGALLLLHGNEPDYRWEAFADAVREIVTSFAVRLVVGLSAIPMGVPHTRPVGVIVHGSRPELVRGRRAWFGEVQVPAYVGAHLEWRLAKSGIDTMAYTVNVPHYIAQSEYPEAAAVLLEHLAQATGVPLDVTALRARAAGTRSEIDAEVAKSSEVLAVVRSLEEQYDSLSQAAGDDLGDDLPDGDELGAELQRFLADQDPDRGSDGGIAP